MNEMEYADNAQAQEEDQEEDGIYQDNEEGAEEDIDDQLRQANAEASNVYISAEDVANQNEQIFKMYSREEIDNFKCIFDMFDAEKSGSVDVQHLQTILKCLGRDPAESADLLKDFNPSQEKLSFAEFLVIMK